MNPRGLIIETKVSLPALVDFVLVTLGSALYGVILAFGWFHPTDAQNAKLAALGGAVVLVVDKVTAYCAPHTDRPDLAQHDSAPQEGAPAVPFSGSTLIAPEVHEQETR